MNIYYSQPAEDTKENKNNVHTIATPRHKKKAERNIHSKVSGTEAKNYHNVT